MVYQQDRDRIHLLGIFPAEIWEPIGYSVRDYRAFQNFVKSSPYFTSIFSVSSFLERLSIHVPFFPMDNPKSRLYEYPSRYLKNIFTSFSSEESITGFTENLQNQSNNPFPGRAVFINLGKGFAIHGLDESSVQCSEKLMSILQKWGHHVWYVSFRMCDPCHTCYTSFCQFMQNMPNLKTVRVMVYRKKTDGFWVRNMAFPHYPQLHYVKFFDVDNFVWEKFCETNSELSVVDVKMPEEIEGHKLESDTTNIYDQIVREWGQR